MAIQAELKIGQRLRRLPHQWRVSLSLWRALGIIGLVLALWGGYALTGRPLTLVINNRPYQIRSHRLTVEAVLQELDLTLEAEDIVRPALETQLSPDQIITIQLARPATVEADSRTFQLLSHQQTASDILAEAGIFTNPRDEILIDGALASPPAPQDAIGRLFAARSPRGGIASARPQMIRLIVHRAIPVSLNDDGASSTFFTTQPNVGEALLEQGLTLFLGDKVTPGLGTRLSPGMRIYIQRSTPTTIIADDQTIKTRSHRKTVAEVLAQTGVALMGQDFSRPAGDHLISAGETIKIVRVRETFKIEQEFISFETNWFPDSDMEIDQQEVRQAGATGVIKSRTRIRYENGQEVWRELEDEWLDQEPSNREIVYGVNVIVRTLDTEDGPIEYWRKIPMVVTGYSAATSGKEPDHPHYGITRSGLPAGFGVAAVDPRVIPLMTNLYVPGYGPVLAGDTGGMILGKRLDLGYEEGQIPDGLYEWRDVYVLGPVPPLDKIRYVLPQWPQ